MNRPILNKQVICEQRASMQYKAQQFITLPSLYDNLGLNEALALRIHTAVRHTKKEGWVGNLFKQREVRNVIRDELLGYNINVDEVLELVKKQSEYQ